MLLARHKLWRVSISTICLYDASLNMSLWCRDELIMTSFGQNLWRRVNNWNSLTVWRSGDPTIRRSDDLDPTISIRRSDLDPTISIRWSDLDPMTCTNWNGLTVSLGSVSRLRLSAPSLGSSLGSSLGLIWLHFYELASLLRDDFIFTNLRIFSKALKPSRLNSWCRLCRPTLGAWLTKPQLQLSKTASF
jgi:hypothetical protein